MSKKQKNTITMKCKEIHTRLIDYMDGELSRDEQERVQKHLQGCPDCREMYQEMAASWNQAREDRISYQPFYYTRLQAKMERQAERYSQHALRRARTFRMLLQPALFFVVLGLGIFIGIQLGKGLGNTSTVAAQTQSPDYIEAYAEDQYWNGLKLEPIEQEYFAVDSAAVSDPSQKTNRYE